MARPHWNAPQQLGKTYHSTRVLGKLFDMLDQKINNLNNKPPTFEPNRHIIDFINKSYLLNQNESLKSNYRIEMRRAVENYDRALSKVMDKLRAESVQDEDQRKKRIWEWRREYCDAQRTILIDNKPVDLRCHAAAMLYQQTFLLSGKKPKAKPNVSRCCYWQTILPHIVKQLDLYIFFVILKYFFVFCRPLHGTLQTTCYFTL